MVQGQFGKLCFRLLDGNVYAQPLYVSQLEIPHRGQRNVLFVATEHNSVYAFDADDTNQNSTTAVIWGPVSLGRAVHSEVLSVGLGLPPGECVDLTTEIGITSTPVIDLASNTIYVVAKTKPDDTNTENYAYTLHVLDIRTGVKLHQKLIQGNGFGSVNGVITFNPKIQLNRPGLLLLNGVLYVAFGGHCDRQNYHGWLFAYDAADITRDPFDIYLTTPNTRGVKEDGEGAIWQSGQGPSADSDSNLYVMTGNGGFNPVQGANGFFTGSDLGNSFVKLKLIHGKFEVVDWFTPHNQVQLKVLDVDLGSSGPLVLPDDPLIVGGGKEGRLYVMSRNNLGHHHPNDDNQIVQNFQVTHPPEFLEHDRTINMDRFRFYNIHGAPVYWNGPTGKFIYLCGEEEPVKAYLLVNGTTEARFNPTTPFAFSDERSSFRQVNQGDPFMEGGILAISAHGNTPGTGIIWASMPLIGSANRGVVPGVLRAFDASNFVTRADGSKRIRQLWSSDHNNNQTNDSLGMHAKFCARRSPTARCSSLSSTPRCSVPTASTTLTRVPRRPRPPWPSTVSCTKRTPGNKLPIRGGDCAARSCSSIGATLGAAAAAHSPFLPARLSAPWGRSWGPDTRDTGNPPGTASCGCISAPSRSSPAAPRPSWH